MPPADRVTTPYLHEMADILQRTEPELWSFFRSVRDAGGRDELRAQLLEKTYRLDPEDHAHLYALLGRAAESLGLELAVTLYQAQGMELPDEGGNATCVSLPDEVHLVFSGRLLDLLEGPQLLAVLGHELAHHVIEQAHDGALGVAGRMLWAAAADAMAQPSHVESARRFQLHLETSADRGGMLACDDLLAAVEALVSVSTGLAKVGGASYLRQAREVLDNPRRAASEALTHPELYIRARALQLWSEQSDGVEEQVEDLLRGKPDLDRLDITDQHRLTDLTRRLVAQVIRPPWMASHSVLAHARLFEVRVAAVQEDAELAQACARAPRVEQDYLATVLLDLATCDPDLADVALAQTQVVAAASGMTEAYDAVVAKELELPVRTVRTRRAGAPALVDKASR